MICRRFFVFLQSLLVMSLLIAPALATDDSVIVQRGIIGKGQGNDLYILSPALIEQNAQITITDTEGSNTIQLIGGLNITSSSISADAMQLTLSNSAVVTILGADGMNYILGGDPLNGLDGNSKNYQNFATDVLGTALPATGITNGGAAVINADGSASLSDSNNQALPSDILLKSIPAGSFTMGGSTTAGDAPETQVTLSAFQISEKEITNQQYISFLNAAFTEGWLVVTTQQIADPCGIYSAQVVIGAGEAPNSGEVFLQLSEEGGCTSQGEEEHSNNRSWISFNNADNQFVLSDQDKADWPVNWVKWYGANAFAQFYSVDLPSEAQWEYAARGGLQLEYPTTDGSISLSQANYNGDLPGVYNANGQVMETGSFAANPFGLYDMGGNVWEWCRDYYADDFYGQSSVEDPINSVAGSGNERVRRGGSWNYHTATLLTYARASDPADRGNNHFGFRIVKN